MQLTFKHLFHCGTTKVFIQAKNKSVSNVCSQDVTACLTLASAANPLQDRSFLESKEMQITWHIEQTVLRVVYNLPTSATTSCKSSSQYEAKCYHAE